MRRIGQVLHISPSQKAVIKAETIPRVGESVLDERKMRVGTVFDVLGSTVSPYVEVEVITSDPRNLVNSILYVSSSKQKMRSKQSK